MTSRNYCITYNNPPDGWRLELDEGGLLRYGAWQLERAASGTLHAQIYVELTRAVRVKQVQDTLFGGAKVHCEPRKGTREQARAYCWKEDTRLPTVAPAEVGTWDAGGQGSRCDLKALATLAMEGTSAREAWELHPAAMFKAYKAYDACRMAFAVKERVPPEVIVYYGASGTGKTRRAEEELTNPYRKEPGQWWDGYDMHSNVLIDDFHAGAAVQYSVLLRILDRYPCSVQVKGSTVPFVGEKIIITSNLSPLEWYPSIPDKLPLVRRLTKVFRYSADGTHAEITAEIKEQARNSAPADFSAFSAPARN